MSKLATWHFHIELSSICAIKCPKCPRQEVPETLVQDQLTLGFFEKNFTPALLENVKQITFCGDDGDPIYCKDFLQIVRYLKTTKPELHLLIITNGAYKTPDWWDELATLLNEHDTVHFSLDGWDQKSNNIYRINTDWESIANGIAHLRANEAIYMVWAAIAFSFNYQHFEHMINVAHDFKMDEFQVTRSTKYTNDDPFEPSQLWVSSSGRFERLNIPMGRKIAPAIDAATKLYNQTETYNGVKPLCHIGTKGLYINSQGEFYPCCWLANRYSHNNSWGKNFNLNTSTLQEILDDEFWDNEFLSFDHLECKTKCNDCEVTLDSIQKW